jgi:hypothetical protein
MAIDSISSPNCHVYQQTTPTVKTTHPTSFPPPQRPESRCNIEVLDHVRHLILVVQQHVGNVIERVAWIEC